MLTLHRDCVPKAIYEQKCAEYKELLEKYDRLKLAGAAPPADPRPARVTPPGPTPEERAAKRMHDQMLENVAETLAHLPGISKDAAKAEAERIRREVLGDGVVP